jgi:hypothetical protein
VLGVWGIHIQEQIKLLGTLGKLGYALHERKNEGYLTNRLA